MSEKTRFWLLLLLLIASVVFAIFIRHTLGENFINQLSNK